MKSLYLSFFLFVGSVTVMSGQSDEVDKAFARKGKWLIETGLSTIGPFGSASGAILLLPEDGGSLGSFAFEGGKFITEDLAWIASFSRFEGFGDATTFELGAKYYINGTIPTKISAGVGSFGNGGEFLSSFSIGYAARLADNILLEPNTGVIYAGGAVFTFGLTFALVI